MKEWQLIDSAFPSGGFAHSLGLESAYHAGEISGERSLRRFLRDALLQTGYMVLPLLNAAHRDPERLEELDGLADAFLTNAVANRASRVQGRAFVAACARIWPSETLPRLEARTANLCCHHAPISGAALRALEVSLPTAQQMAMFLTCRGVLGAAVRLGIVGPYRAQWLQQDAEPVLRDLHSRCGTLDETSLAQPAPLIDLVQGMHDRLYSRLFQS